MREITRVKIFVIAILALLLAAGCTALKHALNSSFVIEKAIEHASESDVLKQVVGEHDDLLMQAVPEILGFEKPMTYLVLFLNNTEIRPGGGFIGSYATLRLDKGKVEVLALEGSESLDARRPEHLDIKPPAPLEEHLGVTQWFFRDANWSADFAVGSQRVLELYAAEGGVAADTIDAVIGITPTVLEEMLDFLGPVTVEGITFSSDDVIERLEYDVEFGYKDRGLDMSERKNIIRPLMNEIFAKTKSKGFSDLGTLVALLRDLADRKHIMIESMDKGLHFMLDGNGWDGRIVRYTRGDYVMWVDANLAALKTDHAIERNLRYDRDIEEDGTSVVDAEMVYMHNGSFDWRTTRYRTYARVYVPMEARLIDAYIVDSPTGGLSRKLTKIDQIDTGTEEGRKWFGAFISIEPGDVRALQFHYALPSLKEDESYELYVQKQLGVPGYDLRVMVEMPKEVVSADPAEPRELWGNNTYIFTGKLDTDRKFRVEY